MIPRILRWFSVGMLAWVITGGSVFAGEGICQVTVYIEGVYNAKVSLSSFKGLKSTSLIAEVEDVKSGQNAKIKIPAEFLPGEFLLRLDYRAKESDHPYPAERSIYINNQDVEIFVNPPYINSGKTKFNATERENTAYTAFMKENSEKRMPLDLLRQFLLSYDQPQSNFYTQAVNEFQQRRLEYNSWLKNQAEAARGLYVSSLFQFQYIPETAWSGSESDRLNQILKNYFEGIDFNDPIIIRTRELSRLMDEYMRMYGMQVTEDGGQKTEDRRRKAEGRGRRAEEELRDSLFTEAGRIACEKASGGGPKVYGWMVDYFYTGYETYKIDTGMVMLKEHINNPKCLTSKKQQILTRLDGMAKLVPGTLAPDFMIRDNQGKNFQFHKWKPKARQKLLLFWTTSCIDCVKLVDELRQWYNQPANKKKLDIAAVNLDEAQVGAEKWETAIVALPGWKHFQAKEGVNSPVAREYAILSTPVMFLVESGSNKIVAVPGDLKQLAAAVSSRQ